MTSNKIGVDVFHLSLCQLKGRTNLTFMQSIQQAHSKYKTHMNRNLDLTLREKIKDQRAFKKLILILSILAGELCFALQMLFAKTVSS